MRTAFTPLIMLVVTQRVSADALTNETEHVLFDMPESLNLSSDISQLSLFESVVPVQDFD